MSVQAKASTHTRRFRFLFNILLIVSDNTALDAALPLDDLCMMTFPFGKLVDILSSFVSLRETKLLLGSCRSSVPVTSLSIYHMVTQLQQSTCFKVRVYGTIFYAVTLPYTSERFPVQKILCREI